MAVTGVHGLLYTRDAEAVRAFLRDTLAWPSVDAGEGWLIFALPPAELGVHPDDTPHHELALVCDDIAATMAELRAKGAVFDGEPVDRRFGVGANLRLPGGVDVLLYEPRHPTAF